MMLTRVYFTFGSWKKYPYQNTYMIVEAETYTEAIAAYREKYPDVHENTLRCADFYEEDVWKSVIEPQYYKDVPPAEILRTELAEKINRMYVLLESALGLAVEGMTKDCDTKKWLLTELGTDEGELKSFGIDLGETIFK